MQISYPKSCELDYVHSLDMTLFNFLLAVGLMPSIMAGSYFINVDPTKSRKEMKHFWKSTGFCPPLPHDQAETYFLGRDQRLNLAYISSVPHGGIVQIRIHWLLDLIKVSVINGTAHYNFTKLDEFMDLLVDNGLVPGFELMGSPSGYFTNFEDKAQVFEWRQLIFLTAKRNIEKYGLEHVSAWNFETWNEPDNHDFDNVSITVKGFQNYYDACSEGLKQASPQLKFGGPGDSCHSPPRSPICWSLLSHCHNGTNIFTGEMGVRLDYIALHKKGGGSSYRILEQELDTVSEIQQRFPQFKLVPIYNDEADPLVGWSTPQSWRGDVTYAAMVIKIIHQHLDFMSSDGNLTMNYSLLSNDNAFMNYYPHYFTQRTLTARFQMNNTKPPHVQMVRKPVLTVMGLLALLDLVYVTYYMDNMLTNPFLEWQKTGSPDFPSVEEFKLIRDMEDPVIKRPVSFPKDGDMVLKVELSVPSVLLVHICEQPQSPPGKVTGLNIIPLFRGQVTVVWSDAYVVTRCLKTYEVEFSFDGLNFRRINTKNIFFTLFTYSPENSTVSGFYRVRAINYWDTPGPYSAPEEYTELL
ncbi:alpha-L-iduronidase isoform X2 [Bufo gargarizans]|uniref:alpha-L-iduronidase isoform X2 n=1 Tax=Bufo gargarizans TaxID=30331 RepID=UPI001CF3D73B|nr:alpha-L-iduronidase isoform X2 [Bufo gargarizans]